MECALHYPTRLGFGALLLASVGDDCMRRRRNTTRTTAFSSASYLGIPILCIQPAMSADACRGAIAIRGPDYHPSALTWIYKRFWSWPADARDGAGVDNNNVWYPTPARC